MEPDYPAAYSEDSFWDKLRRVAKVAGRELVEKVLVLYFALRDKDTPKWARAVITGALGYFIVPLDAIPDVTPAVGYADDLGAILVALGIIAAHVKEDHWQRSRETLDRWFGAATGASVVVPDDGE